MRLNADTRISIIKIMLLIEGVLLFFWWPVTHLFFSDFYHKLLGFSPGSYPQPMIVVIGACGLCIVIFTMLAAKDPVKNRDIVVGLIITSFILVFMYAYQIINGSFPVRELFNIILSLVSGVAILIIYPWKEKKELENKNVW